MKHLIRLLASFFLCIASCPSYAARPNVLFISIDDLRCELGCYGVQEIKSPHIDKLAASGVTFTRAYVQVAVCNPSRVSVMTGLRPDTTKVWDLKTEFRTVAPNAETIPQRFRKHGYHAVSFGKIFHNPWPDNVSWDEPHKWPKAPLWSANARKNLASYRKGMRAQGKSDAKVARMRAVAIESVDVPDSAHKDGAIADQGLAAMERLAKQDRPFFLAVGFVRPHLPFVVPKKYWDLYDRAKIPLAKNQFLPSGAPALAFGDGSRGGFYELQDYMDFADTPSPFDKSLTEAQQRELKHGYYASVSFIDAQVGRLLARLEELKLAENTIVVLWSDHGWKLGEHNGWCKQTNYEIDTRAPLIIRAPGARANGEKCDALTEFLDIYPTLCDLADVPAPEALQGVSLKPLLADAAGSVKQTAFSQFQRRHERKSYMGYAVRTERYRYVEWISKATGEVAARELYDHKTDPQENENVADRPKNADIVSAHSAKLKEGFDRDAWLE